MGYQESYIRMKNKNDFSNLVDVIKGIGKDYYYENGAYPVEIITLNRPISGDLEFMNKPNQKYNFESGEKFIYFVGERYLQSNMKNLLANKSIEGVEIYFSECFPSEEIFEIEENTYATHEEFIWDKDNLSV